MEEKKGFSEKLNEFFAGKGFYIVLLLCAALIGTSIWLMTDGSRTDVEPVGGDTMYASVDAGENSTGDSVPAMQMDPAPQTDAQRKSQPTPAPTPEAPDMTPEAPQVATEPETDSVPNPQQTQQTGQTAQEAVDYFIWPVNGTLARPYSVEVLSFDRTMSDWRVHSGWDIAAEQGTQVLSTANGVVSAIYEDVMMGNVVEVSHSNGLVSAYANLNEDIPVNVGQPVSVGSVLGTVGRSALGEIGEVDHLHFSLRMSGETVDPTDWLPKP